MRKDPEHRGDGEDVNALYARARRGDGTAGGRLEDLALPALATGTRLRFRSLAPWEADEVASDAFALFLERSPEIPSWPEADAFLKRTARLMGLNRARKCRRLLRNAESEEQTGVRGSPPSAGRERDTGSPALLAGEDRQPVYRRARKLLLARLTPTRLGTRSSSSRPTRGVPGVLRKWIRATP